MKTPYDRYKKSKLWANINASISDLVKNNDIVETTNREYIIGFIVSNLIENNNDFTIINNEDNK